MTSKIKEYYHDGMAVVVTNPSYYALASIIELIVLILIIYTWSPLGISEKNPVLCIIFILFIVFFQLMTYSFVKNRDILKQSGIESIPSLSDVSIKILFTILTICCSVIIIACFFWIATNIPSVGQILLYLVDALIIIGVLSIIYVIVSPLDAMKTRESKGSFISLIGALIMYMPCALIDTVDWAKNQYHITSKTIWIIITIEFLFIALRILIPKLLTFVLHLNGEHLLRDPVYMDNAQELGNYETLHKGNSDNASYKYSISAWFWINPQPPSTRSAYTKFTNILEFGRKPAIEFNGLENVLRVNCQIKDDIEVTIFETREIVLQAWNNIVINYDGATMDVFLNGDLVGSRPEIAPYMTMENINIGSERGIEGGICNVVFYKEILQERQIIMAYNALSGLPVPLI